MNSNEAFQMTHRVSVSMVSIALLLSAACQDPDNRTAGGNVVINLDSSFPVDMAQANHTDDGETSDLSTLADPPDAEFDTDAHDPADQSVLDLGSRLLDSSTQPDASQNMQHQCGPYDLSDLNQEQLTETTWLLRGVVGVDRFANGSCAGSGAETVIPWTAPLDGVYTFSTVSKAEFDTTLYARTTCLDPNSELDCNDDSIGLQSTIIVQINAGRTIYLFIDAWAGGENQPFEVAVFRAAVDEPPSVTQLIANRIGDSEIAVAYEGRDANADARFAVVALGDEQAPSDEFSQTLVQEIFGLQTFTGTLRIQNPNEQLASHLWLSLRDWSGQVGESVQVQIGERVIREIGEDCDSENIETVCVDGTFCPPNAGDLQPICSEPTRPEIRDANIWRRDIGATIRLSGLDETRDVTSVQLTPKEINGAVEGPSQTRLPLESVRGSQEFEFIALSETLLSPTTHSADMVLIDSQGLMSEPVNVLITDLPIGGAGDQCDPFERLNRCADGLACLDSDMGYQCQEITAPVIDRATVSFNPALGTVGVRVFGQELDQDLASFTVVFRSADNSVIGEINRSPFRQIEYRNGVDFEATWSGRSRLDLDVGTHAILTLFDRLDLASDTENIPVTAPLVADANRLCDPYWALNQCAPGTGCFDRIGSGEFRCVAVAAPNVESAALWYNLETDGIGIRLQGTDQDSDVIGFQLELFDVRGEPLLNPDNGTPFRLQFDSLTQFAGTFTGVTSFLYADLMAQLGHQEPYSPPARAQLSAVDAALLASAPMDLLLEPPPMVADGVRCDPIGATNRCEPNSACVDFDLEDGNLPQCLRRQSACPADVAPQDLNDGLGMNGWSVDTDTRNDTIATRGSCLNRLMGRVYRFIAPADGSYRFWTEGVGEDPIRTAGLLVRSACAFPDQELACEASPHPRTTVVIPLEAEQSVYVFAGKTVQWADGDFRLQAAPHIAPALGRAEAWLDRTSSRLSLDVAGLVGSAQVTELKYSLFDLDGEVLSTLRRTEAATHPLEVLVDNSVNPAQFSGEVNLSLDAIYDRQALAQAQFIRIQAIDEFGGLSDAQDTFFSPPTPLVPGQMCDPSSARAICPLEYACFDPAPDQPQGHQCRLFSQTCPEDWTTIVLNSNNPVGPWFHDGDLARAAPALEAHGQPTCSASATGFNDLFEFTAERAGRYHFSTSGDLADTILWVRSACSEPAPIFELACNDDSVGAFSAVNIDMTQNQTVYVFVDSYEAEGRGPYRLTARLDE
ncbi:MAG: hypothetical protein VYA30_00905 [Myxococcota bacterium]|nr:hypothetical protein [Myxococcota bacterium]